MRALAALTFSRHRIRRGGGRRRGGGGGRLIGCRGRGRGRRRGQRRGQRVRRARGTDGMRSGGRIVDTGNFLQFVEISSYW